jgi:hypothetical protein
MVKVGCETDRAGKTWEAGNDDHLVIQAWKHLNQTPAALIARAGRATAHVELAGRRINTLLGRFDYGVFDSVMRAAQCPSMHTGTIGCVEYRDRSVVSPPLIQVGQGKTHAIASQRF